MSIAGDAAVFDRLGCDGIATLGPSALAHDKKEHIEST